MTAKDDRALLAVDDENTMHLVYRALFSEYDLHLAFSADEARALLRRAPVRLVLLDLGLPGESGMELLAWIRAQHPQTEVIVVTSDATVASGVQAMKHGARDYVVKPFDDEALAASVARFFRGDANREKAARWAKAEPGRRPLLGESPPMHRVRGLIDKAAASDAPVFIHGESGTGKELVARAIHTRGPRAEGPFVGVNCGAFPADLVNSELFGHEKGAFTGASQARKGCFEQAADGILFLDELGSLPPETQVRLLRALEEKSITRVGGEREIPVDIRIIAATNSDIQALVAAGRFRDDLFYRLHVLEISLPPLRERGEDVMLLAQYFLQKYNVLYGREVRGFSVDCEWGLRLRQWPGNVRELENLVHRMVVDCEGDQIMRLSAGDGSVVPGDSASAAGGHQTLAEAQREFRRAYIRHALDRCDGDKRRAAGRLGISVASLYRLLASDSM